MPETSRTASGAALNPQRQTALPWWRTALQGVGIYLAVFVLLAMGRMVSDSFFAFDNFINIIRTVSLLGIVAVGVAFITYSGHYVDMAIPSIMAMSGFVAVMALPHTGAWGACLAGMGAGVLAGLVNGLVVGYLRLNPIIWTLAFNFILDGTLRWYFSSKQLYPNESTPDGLSFVGLSRAMLGGSLPAVSVLWLALAILGWWLMRRSRFGALVELTGSSYEVARLSGVNVRRVVLSVFVLSGLLTAVAGVLLTSLVKQAAFENGGGYDFNSITAVVLGGVSLSGGKGGMAGVVGGALVIGLLGNIMTLFGCDSFTQMMIRGGVFILLVAADSYLSSKSGRSDG